MKLVQQVISKEYEKVVEDKRNYKTDYCHYLFLLNMSECLLSCSDENVFLNLKSPFAGMLLKDRNKKISSYIQSKKIVISKALSIFKAEQIVEVEMSKPKLGGKGVLMVEEWWGEKF